MSPPLPTQGDGFCANRRSGPNVATYSASTGSSRRSRGTSGKRARNSPTVISARTDWVCASRSGVRRICMRRPPGTDYYGLLLSALDAILEHLHALDPREAEEQLDEIHRGLSGDLLHEGAECFLHVLTDGYALDRQTAEVDLDPLVGLKHLRASSGPTITGGSDYRAS